MNRNIKILLVIVVAAILFGVGGQVWANYRAHPNNSAAIARQMAAQQPAKPEFDKHQFSTTDPTSIWVIVDKLHPLKPKDFTPDLASPKISLRLSSASPEMQVSSQAAQALEDLVAAAKQEGLQLMLASGYRSYATQVTVYGNEVKKNGQKVADTESARPGFSEHQTGLAADLEPVSRKCEVQACFADLPEGKWLAENAYNYGFVIRYDEGKSKVTGYTYEPWHVRFVGKTLAEEIHKQGNPPLETFFNLGPAADYKQ
jgi:D-alanyl-D-alanine carboxypeptidase